MASFTAADYDKLFTLGRELYAQGILPSRRREIAVTLMAMSEHVHGQRVGWPNVARRYRHLTSYPPAPAATPSTPTIKWRGNP